MGTVLRLYHVLAAPPLPTTTLNNPFTPYPFPLPLPTNTLIVTPLPLTLSPYPSFRDLYNSHPNYIDATPSIIVRYIIIDIYPLGGLSCVAPLPPPIPFPEG